MDIIKTKLHKPSVSSDSYVIRNRLWTRLDRERDKNVILVVAATGFGKSVTISQWLDHIQTKNCWISLDENLNDLSAFLSYVVTSVRSILPDALEELHELLTVPALHPRNILVNTLINGLDDIEEELIIVLDDYQVIHNDQIHYLMDELLKYIPQHLRLVICTRRDPPLHLSLLKSFDRVKEVRMADLAFDQDEIRELAMKVAGKKISDQSVQILFQKTEGWIVGLRLALLALEHKTNVEDALNELKGGKHHFAEYLLNEVVAAQDKLVQELLFIASLVERFNQSLLLDMLSKHHGNQDASIIATIEEVFARFRKSSLFIIPLDYEGTWFRYHHFFRELMQSEMVRQMEFPDVEVRALHQQAGEWFYNHELFDEAMNHAMKAGDTSLAVKIVEKNKYPCIESDQFGRLRGWLDLLPEETVSKNLNLLLARAFLCDTIKDFVAMEKNLLQADTLLAVQRADPQFQVWLEGEYYAIHSNLGFFTGRYEDAYQYSLKALPLLPESAAYFRLYAYAQQIFALNALGKFDQALANINQALIHLSPADSVSLMRYLVVQSFLHSFRGNLPSIMNSAPDYHRLCISNKLWVSLSYSTYYLSDGYYQWNRLPDAVKYATTLEGHYYSGRPQWVLQTLFAKAFALQVMGKAEELNHTLFEIRNLTESFNNEIFYHFTRSFEVEIALRFNDIDRASALAEITNFDSLVPVCNFYFPRITKCRWLLSLQGPDKILEAEILVDALIKEGRTSFKYNLLMQALLMQALLCTKKNLPMDALAALREAVALAEPGGFIRIFTDIGKPMQEMIEALYHEGPKSTYLSTILHSFDREQNHHSPRYPQSPTFSNGLIKLTEQEMKLLDLIATGHRNQEIARQLFLSTDSIKKYLYNMYQKLEVNNRVAAIVKATELGWINPLERPATKK